MDSDAKSEGIKMLIVDWDYFFPVKHSGHEGPLYDWGHSEEGVVAALAMSGELWTIRAAGFLQNGLPLPGTSGEETNFWNRFVFSPETKLSIAESNAMAFDAEMASKVNELWLYDAHHDSGYSAPISKIAERGFLTCEDWMIGYWSAGLPPHKMHMRYPGWNSNALLKEPRPKIPALDRRVDNKYPVTETINHVFVCRSSSWVPSWLDPYFTDFVLSCPVNAKPVEIDRANVLLPRRWDQEEAEKMASEVNAHIASVRVGH
jgi:hypothetical protein